MRQYKMKATVTILFILFNVYVYAEKISLCPNIDDYKCLVNHSISIYRENPDKWFQMYKKGYDKALISLDGKDMSLYLSLAEYGKTDGEMAQQLHEDIDLLIQVTPESFFEGVDKTSKGAKAYLLKGYCPSWDYKKTLNALVKYTKNGKYKKYASLMEGSVKKCITEFN